MVSESNTNRRHLKFPNIKYITITTLQNQGGILKIVVYQMGPDMGSKTFVFESM